MSEFAPQPSESPDRTETSKRIGLGVMGAAVVVNFMVAIGDYMTDTRPTPGSPALYHEIGHDLLGLAPLTGGAALSGAALYVVGSLVHRARAH